MKKTLFCIFILLVSVCAHAQIPEKKWYDKYSIRGYVQFRYNRLGSPDSNLVSEHDRSIGDNNSFLIRRGRLIFFGDVNDHLSIYLQPDFASVISNDAWNFAQLRDYYADIFFDQHKAFRVRAGQSKVPFGFENMQSSQNRLALDRNDALNSGVKDERDLGLFFYWSPPAARRRFKELVDRGLKGTGDYGVVGLGVYNGQGTNKREQNNNRHLVVHLTYPYLFENGQIFELGTSAYSGKYTPTKTTGVGGPATFADERVAASFVLYPQPIGLQGEYTFGRGPQLNDAQNAVDLRPLQGGYLQTMFKAGNFMPFVRWQYYNGARKAESNAPRSYTRETELGLEWQALPAVELTGMYTFTNRTSNVSPYRNARDQLIRFQLQWNY